MAKDPNVGYCRPPEHTRFQKGQSGNPGGKPGPKKRLKYAFDAALGGALEADRWELKDARPTQVIEALVRKITLDALDGRAPAQRLLLSVLDGPDREPEPEPGPGTEEYLRRVLGERYDAYRARVDSALAREDRDELATIAKEIELLEQFPASGIF